MIKIVPDANIIISAMIGHHESPSRKIVNLALAKKILIFGSRETYNEFCDKIKMQRLRKYLVAKIFTPEKMIIDYKSFVNIVNASGELVGINVIKDDPSDDEYLRVAKACGSKIIISGDKHVINLKKYDGIITVRASNFLTSFSRLN